MKQAAFRISALLIIFLLGMHLSAQAAEESGSPYASGRVLVKFEQLPSAAQLRNFAAAHRLLVDRVIPRVDVFRFRISDGQTVANVVERLKANGLVEFAEPDYIRFPYYVPDDPLFSSQWDMSLVGLPDCWDLELGDPTVVNAVLDTGIDLDHPDLINQLWLNSDEIPGNGEDDDSNGYKDDINGYDFAGNGLFPMPGAEDPIPEDPYVGHGTHVSGTIAAEQDNTEGISGEAPGTKLMAVRVLGGLLGAGYSSDIVEGIIYAVDNGASVINMSLGGTAKSLTEYNALKYAWDRNVFIAAAAGNDGAGANPLSYPAAYVFAMSVGATDSDDNIASFSTHNEFVEISAPGVTILSTVPGGQYESGIWSGTSMATPHVAGLAALLYSHYPGIKNWQVRSMLQSNALDLGAAGWDEFFGHGRADCTDLLTTPLPSDSVLSILTPPDGAHFRSGAIISSLWNPVAGAVGYVITATLPGGGGTKIITTPNPYYTVHPSIAMPAGTYSVMIEAKDAGGATVAFDTVSFSR